MNYQYNNKVEQRTKKMKFKKVLPYFLFGSLFVTTPQFVESGYSTAGKSLFYKYSLHKYFYVEPYSIAEQKTNKLINTYLSNVLNGQQNIKQNTHIKGYRSAVKSELPGAPVGLHCLFGLYTELNRALQAYDDTICIIPKNANMSCPQFRYTMKKKYPSAEYPSCIHFGKLFKSNKEFETAWQNYVKFNQINGGKNSEQYKKARSLFEQKFFSIENLNPGTIFIIQHNPHSPNNTHAVVFLGRGKIEGNAFVPDSNGNYMVAGFNNESIVPLFKTFNTNNIFAADIQKIAQIEFTKEAENKQENDNFAPKNVYSLSNIFDTANKNQFYDKYIAFTR